MRTFLKAFVIIGVVLPLFYQCSKDSVSPRNNDDPEPGPGITERPYFGQTSPGSTPVPFMPQIFPDGTFGVTFSPDGLECFFTVINPDPVIMTTKDSSGIWHTPEVAPFCGTFENLEPHIPPDGDKVYFATRRILDGVFPEFLQQWYVSKTDSGWSEPQPMEAPLRGLNMFYPSVADNGNMYFTSLDENDDSVIRMSQYVNGQYQDPVVVMQDFNGGRYPGHPFIALDENYMLFDARPGGDFWKDLYVVFQNPDQTWSNPRRLTVINTAESETAPFVSRDGNYLFFSRSEGGGPAELYWVDASIIEQYR